MEQDMWAAAVSETVEEIASEPYGSVEYGQAVAFFTDARGQWAESRQNIADCLNLHGDDLSRLGRAAIARRHLRDGPEPIRVRIATNLSISGPTKDEGLTCRGGHLAPGLCVTNPTPVVPLVLRGRPPDGVARPPKHKRAMKERRNRQWWITQFMAKQAA